jgi:hypothetical protein
LDALGEKEASRNEWLKVAELKAIDSQDRRYQSMPAQRLKQGLQGQAFISLVCHPKPATNREHDF